MWPDIDVDPGQALKAIFAPTIAGWNLVSGLTYSQTPWGRRDQVNGFLQVYNENCGGIEGLWTAANVTFNPVYSILASGAEAYDQARAGNYGDAVVAADTAILIAAATVAGAKGTAAAVRGAFSRPAGPVVGPPRSTGLVLDSFRSLDAGRNARVRTVPSVSELQATFDAWIVGAERLPPRGPSVPDVYQLPDGGVIQWRTSSRTGGPAIDIFPTGGRQRTVHVEDGSQ